MNSQSVTIQLGATEQHLPVVLFIMLHKVVLTFQSAILSGIVVCVNDIILKLDARKE